MKIWQMREEDRKSMKTWQILTRSLKKYENLANFEKETEKVWKSGKYWQRNWKSMKIWQILTKKLKKYENLVNFDKETEKVWKSGKILRRKLKKYENLVWKGSTRFSYFFCYVYEGLFIFTRFSYFFCLNLLMHQYSVQL